MTGTVAIIDSGGANIASLVAALERLGARHTLTTDPEVVRGASHVILPGVGAAADAMLRLQRHGLDGLIPALRQPVLGICLGLQLFAERSEEDGVECLGILPGAVTKLPASPALPVPNMGWCPVTTNRAHPVMDGIEEGSHFYFVHSYALPVDDYSVAEAQHATPLTAVAAASNFVAAQFHPERSAAAGARFLRNFLSLAS